ncbi:MAG TPA: response regulator transcription factor, partial [Blastocatellia bacterium]|nr:response regulator transcription factor [Blastocatellia bacterium]
EALLRRSASASIKPEELSILDFGDLKIDLSRHRVTLQEQDVTLTPIEFDILKMLARRPGVVFSREQILDEIWQTSYEGYKRNIDPHVNRLRAKLEANPRKPQYVQTVWGVGYKFNDSAAIK